VCDYKRSKKQGKYLTANFQSRSPESRSSMTADCSSCCPLGDVASDPHFLIKNCGENSVWTMYSYKSPSKKLRPPFFKYGDEVLASACTVTERRRFLKRTRVGAPVCVTQTRGKFPVLMIKEKLEALQGMFIRIVSDIDGSDANVDGI
jgi:hypothetical protein